MKNPQKQISIIDKGLSVDGTVSFRGQLIVKGAVRGNLNGETVVIAEEGVVQADTKARSITIAGTFEMSLTRCNTDIIVPCWYVALFKVVKAPSS